jgi:signal transduction histidine kinase
MSNNQNIPPIERINFLEAELEKLKKNIAQKNREIEVEKALEKVRIRALDMRNSTELSETSIILFQQLKELNIDAVRSGVGIFDDENSAIELWITSVSDNGSLFFVLDYINVHEQNMQNVHLVFQNIIGARKNQPFVFTKLEGKDLVSYYKTMSSYAGIPRIRENILCEYYYSFFFSAGTINVVVRNPLTEEETDIMFRMTNVFGLIYTRFLDLKKSEEQAVLIGEEKNILESTLNDLKATQAQLIQTEKMASLGELTAGIAHEIQNPLNFVNNFSEVNTELVDELKSQLTTGNMQSAIEIADDIKGNEQKINHHGKRADAIVKGMLQHSRISSGKKEPTDINALCDEYLRLAYHGFRAKNKSFNAKFETDFDDSIGNISGIPQDIGRALLNLINNAFYAVAEKKKTAGNNYEPTFTIFTKKLDDKVEIVVKDNGNGIPQKVIDKIFQPFFTTKPTGQGTGLGLSLAYDIVKAHGGEIKVNTREGEFTEFVVQLPISA